MYAAILILEKAYSDGLAMQPSPEAHNYLNQIQLAIRLLKKYNDKMEKAIEDTIIKI